jgi:hypothetical protein
VTNAAGDIIEVRLAGAISGEGKEITVSGTGEFEGRLVFNRRGELQELLVLYEGTYQGGLIDRFNGNEGTSLEGIVQWRRSVEKTPENEN